MEHQSVWNDKATFILELLIGLLEINDTSKWFNDITNSIFDSTILFSDLSNLISDISKYLTLQISEII